VRAPYRTAAIVPAIPTPKPVTRRQSPAPRRTLLVVGAWAPVHLLLATACSRGLGLQGPLFLVLCTLSAFACALHACVARDYDEAHELTASFTPSASARRLLWALVLLVPVAGVVIYLIWYARLPEPSDVNSRGLQSVEGADSRSLGRGF
jgi:hypothetical protein